MKRIKNVRLLLYCLGMGVFFYGCVEPFEATTQGFEDTLVIDALLTDEMKQHRVVLERSSPFSESGSNPVAKADVQIVDDQGTVYRFAETQAGQYVSEQAFAAVQGSTYSLKIKTSDGKSYGSETVSVPNAVPIGNIEARRSMNGEGEEGVGILLDNTSNASMPTYFRYEYDETYKVIAPRWNPFEFEVVHYIACDTLPYEVDTKVRTEEQRICYGNRTSNRIIQTATVDLNSNQIEDFEILFIDRTNYILSHRYSIKVRQYSQTPDAYTFYQRLEDFSSSENIFSQVQPGFFQGNVFSETNEDEKVLGFFEVASVSEQRIFFDYDELFANEPLPPYPVNCETARNPPLYSQGYHCADFRVCDGDCDSPLIEGILAGVIVYLAENETPTGDTPGPYFVLPSPCGDCTKLGSNIVPDFWEE